MYKLKSVKDADVKGKIVFLRADLDVPLFQKSKMDSRQSIIADDSRLSAWFPTLEYLVRQNAQVVIAGHLGRPEKEFPFFNFQFSGENEKYSLEPVVKWIAKKINSKPFPMKLNDFEGFRLAENVFVLENLRFYKEEEGNGEGFAKKLSSLAQVYVNDAFASAHRAHASITGITKYLPSYAGLRIIDEVDILSKVLESPKRPLTVIIGGAKIETKLPLVEKMHKFADYVLVGGEIAENIKVLLKVAHEKIEGQKSALIVADLTENSKDITQKSAENFVQISQSSKTIVWNGPMGYINENLKIKNEKLKIGDEGYTSYVLAQGIINSNAHTIVGGGDTIAYLKKAKFLEKFDFASTGGGAMLEFLVGEKLPGIEVLKI